MAGPDDLGDLSDMSKLGQPRPSRTTPPPTSRPTGRPSGRPLSDPTAEPPSSGRPGPPPGGPRRSSAAPVLVAVLVLLVGLGVGMAFFLSAVETTTTGALEGLETDTSDAVATTERIDGLPGEPAGSTTVAPLPPASLFEGGFPVVFADLLTGAGNPEQILEVAVYDTYAFLAYRDPAQSENIDRRDWRDGRVGDAEPNIIDDRVDADTEPALFSPAELDGGLLAQLGADAITRYEVPTEVSHVIVNRFLPFDERVLIRVYVTPVDGRSGGGYVSYDTAGTFVKLCC